MTPIERTIEIIKLAKGDSADIPLEACLPTIKAWARAYGGVSQEDAELYDDDEWCQAFLNNLSTTLANCRCSAEINDDVEAYRAKKIQERRAAGEQLMGGHKKPPRAKRLGPER